MPPLQPNWRKVNVPRGTIFDALNSDFLGKPSAIPSFADSQSLLISSDYSGESSDEPYVVYSFLFAGDRAWASWEQKRRLLREQILPDGRRMSYKKLGDVYRRRFLRPILDAVDDLDGLSISFAISKTAPSLFPPLGPLDLANPEFSVFRGWKNEVLEKAFTVLHLAGFLLAGVGHEKQNVWWFTDQDEIAANPGMLTALTKAFAWVSSGYLDVDLGHLRCGTTSCDNGNRQIEDFVSMPDLIAGALSEQFRSSSLLGVRADNVLWFAGAGMKEKAQSILFWYATSQKNLKKHVFVIDPTSDGKSHKVSWFNYTHESEQSE
ncbi:MAG: hypothetical protein PHE83_05290 [Opitutaceae bacterium]|nr:hypothetical protein [Opitutaceae bacterium]